MEGLTCDCGPQCGVVGVVVMNGSSFAAGANGSLSLDGNATAGYVSGADSTGKLLENLIPALMKTFLVILTGFIMGSTGVYPKENAAAIGRLCGTLLLPVAMFNSMATLVVTDEAWLMFYAVAISKGAVFLLVLCGLIVVLPKKGGLGRAAIWAIFSTQSNDFALGLPIFNVLYATVHTDYLYFLYIVAPVNLVFLNPIAFILMAMSRSRDKGRKFECKLVGEVLKNVFTNPLVLLTFAGVIVRLSCQVPASDFEWYANYIEPVLSVISSAFTGCALFSLGLLIVGKFKLLKKQSPVMTILFVIVKSVILPVAIKLTLSLLAPGNDALSSAGFLYGIIPTASGVFTYCLQFGLSPDIIAVSMVVGTIASAPLMLGLGTLVVAASDPNFTLEVVRPITTYFKMTPVAFSLFGALFFVIATAVNWKKIHPDYRIYRICLLSAAIISIIGYSVLFPCEVMLSPFVTNASAPELYTSTAQAMFLIQHFAITFYRSMVSAVALLSCVILLYFKKHKKMPPAKQQTMMMIWVHICVALVAGILTLTVVMTDGLAQNSCVTQLSRDVAIANAAILFLLVGINVASMMMFNRIRRQLKQLDMFQPDAELRLNGSRAVTSAAVGEALGDIELSPMSSLHMSTSRDQEPTLSDRHESTDICDASTSMANAEHAQSARARRVDHGAEISTPVETVDSDCTEDSGEIREEPDQTSLETEHEEAATTAPSANRDRSPATKFLRERRYNRRYSIMIYETCVSTLGIIGMLTSALDPGSSDIIQFTVSISLTLLTYSSGIVLCVALGFKMLGECKLPKVGGVGGIGGVGKSMLKLRSKTARKSSMAVGLEMDF